MLSDSVLSLRVAGGEGVCFCIAERGFLTEKNHKDIKSNTEVVNKYLFWKLKIRQDK